jgi:hypothetical protein
MRVVSSASARLIAGKMVANRRANIDFPTPGGPRRRTPTPKATDKIRRALEKRKIRPDFYFIGMNVPPDQQRQLDVIQRVTKGKISYVKNQYELENIIEKLFEIEPVIADIKSVTNILNSTLEYLNKSATFLNQKLYLEAENQIKTGFKALEETDLAFRDLEKRLTREDFRRLYELIKVNKGLQDKILRNFESSIPLARNDHIDDYNKLVHKGNEMVSIYDNNVRKIDEILKGLQKT